MDSLHNIIKPLGDHLEAFYPNDHQFYDLDELGHAKRIQLSTYSDTMLKIVLEFSYNGQDVCLNTSQRSSSIWLCTNHGVPMRYLRIHVINESHQRNDQLKVTARIEHTTCHPGTTPSVEKKVLFSGVEEPLASIEDEPMKSKSEGGKSPFARAFTLRKQATVKNVCKIPDYLPKDCLLFSLGSTVTFIPKGSEGDVLTMRDGRPCWIPLVDTWQFKP